MDILQKSFKGTAQNTVILPFLMLHYNGFIFHVNPSLGRSRQNEGKVINNMQTEQLQFVKLAATGHRVEWIYSQTATVYWDPCFL